MWLPSTAPLHEKDLHCTLVVVHYWAEWDQYDREMDNTLASLRCSFGDVCLRSCDIDQAENRPFIHNVANLPALGCFIHGDWFETVCGLRKHELGSLLERWRKTAADEHKSK
jgi:hypothetical protein